MQGRRLLECAEVEPSDVIPRLKTAFLASKTDDLPLIITRDLDETVAAVRCDDNSVHPLDAAFAYSATVGADGLPLIATDRGIIRCLTPSCSEVAR